MRYYDLIETPETGKIYLEAGENRIAQTDERVKCWFLPVPSGYQRAYDADGFPFNELIPDVVIPIEYYRTEKLAEMRTECESHIVAGFIASILFPDCNYRNDRDQQQTIREAAESSSGGYIWMNEDFTHHSKPQAQSVFALSKSEKASHQLTYSQKCEYVGDPARTKSQIDAVTWGSVEQ